MNRRLTWLALALLLGGCECNDGPTTAPPTSSSTASSASPTTSADARTAAQAPALRTRRGSTVAVTEAGDAVLVAEEDRQVLWKIPTPVTADSRPQRIDMPGRPAQVLPLPEGSLVTIRDPGLMLVLDEAGQEQARVPVAPDAWGLAVTADAETALVSSAWTHTITAIDLKTHESRWTVDVAREPRAIVIPKAGDHAYVTHVVGTALSRIDGLSSTSPKVTRLDLPAAASRNPNPDQVRASLAYSAVLSPGEDRLFVPRLALGAVEGWDGAGTVDVLGTGDDEPLAPLREPVNRPTRLTDFLPDSPSYAPHWRTEGPFGMLPFAEGPFFVQPRAVVYRRATDSLLVASEGTDEIVELDARWLEPALFPRKRYRLGGGYGKAIVVADHGGAPSGIALSADEKLAYVFCRTTSDLAVVPLVALDTQTSPEDTTLLRLADEDPMLEGLAAGDPKRKFRKAAVIGRKLFYNALDERVSGGLACAGCHPEGRDDGHVWTEASAGDLDLFVGGPAILKDRENTEKLGVAGRPPGLPAEGRARQTPMLAGRLRAEGVFGWQGESATLIERVEAGFRLHRWRPSYEDDLGGAGHAGAIASFLLSGLVEPPRPEGPPTEGPLAERWARGKAIFESDDTGCTACHSPEEKFSNWLAVKVKVPGRRAGFTDESSEAFKTPSLRFVGGTPPYYHDGSVATLADLVAQNGNRMGKTAHLSPADQSALVAYLETL